MNYTIYKNILIKDYNITLYIMDFYRLYSRYYSYYFILYLVYYLLLFIIYSI